MSGCDGTSATICGCGEPRHHYLPTMGCRCGTRIALDPDIAAWTCPSCGRQYVRAVAG